MDLTLSFKDDIKDQIPEAFNNFDVGGLAIIRSKGTAQRVWNEYPGHLNYKKFSPREYRYNKDFFRSEDFNNSGDINILFSGCSQTEGVCINQEETWAYKFYSKIQNKFNLNPYSNLAVGGHGYHKIISNIQVYVERYGAPSHIIILMPDLYRGYEWKNDGGMSYKNDGLKFAKKEKFANKFIEFIMHMKLFERYCSSMGISLMWSSWDDHLVASINNLMEKDTNLFTSYISIDVASLVKEYMLGNRMSMNDYQSLFAEDGRHMGPVMQEVISNYMILQSEKLGFLK